MLVPSAFQRLPLHIAERIVKFFVYKYGVFDIPMRIESTYELQTWRILYDISYSWRILALTHFCRQIELELSTRPNKREFAFNCLPDDIEPRIEYYRRVKQVNIVFGDLSDHSLEQQHQLVLDGWPEGVVFPSACALSISIEGDAFWGVIVDVPVSSELFGWIAQRIRTSLPKLREAHINRNSLTSYKIDPEREMPAATKANGLFQLVLDRVKMFVVYTSPTCLSPCDLYFQNNPGLVRLHYDCRYNVEFMHFIILKAAPTLEKLNVYHFPVASTRLLVFRNDDDEPVIYPQLRSLSVEASMSSGTVRKVRVNRSVSLFPVLRYLRWEAPYLFEDDTPFRGNNATLEYLHQIFGSELMDTLQKKSDFQVGNFPRLRNVIAMSTFEDDLESGTLSLLARYTARFVSSATQFFWTDIPYSYQDLVSIVTTRSFAESIQELTMEQTTLSLLQIIEIIKILPRMTAFACVYGKVDVDFDGHQNRAITDRLYEKYYPLSRCFKFWTISGEDEATTNAGICSATLALSTVCPSFVHVSSPSCDLITLRRELKMAIDTGGYDETVERIVDPFHTGPLEP